jgi:hypothetical protein
MKQQTTSKPVSTPASKPAASSKGKPTGVANKPASKPKTGLYAGLLKSALVGEFGALIQAFYVSAIAYHTKQKTMFPRGRIMAVELLKPVDAKAFIEKHRSTSIPAGSLTGQRIFDQMMIETKNAK